MFLSGSSAGIRAGAVWTRECRTAGIRKLRPATDRRSLPGHPGAGGQRSGGVLLTGPDHGAHSSSFFFPFFCVSLDITEWQHTNTNSRTLTHMHKSKDRHIYGKDWQLTSQLHAWIGFEVWERWAFLLSSPTTTFIPSAPSQYRLHS